MWVRGCSCLKVAAYFDEEDRQVLEDTAFQEATRPDGWAVPEHKAARSFEIANYESAMLEQDGLGRCFPRLFHPDAQAAFLIASGPVRRAAGGN